MSMKEPRFLVKAYRPSISTPPWGTKFTVKATLSMTKKHVYMMKHTHTHTQTASIYDSEVGDIIFEWLFRQLVMTVLKIRRRISKCSLLS